MIFLGKLTVGDWTGYGHCFKEIRNMYEQSKQDVQAKGSSSKERGNCEYLHPVIFEGGKGRDWVFGCSRVVHVTRPVSVLCGASVSVMLSQEIPPTTHPNIH